MKIQIRTRQDAARFVDEMQRRARKGREDRYCVRYDSEVHFDDGPFDLGRPTMGTTTLTCRCLGAVDTGEGIYDFCRTSRWPGGRDRGELWVEDPVGYLYSHRKAISEGYWGPI